MISTRALAFVVTLTAAGLLATACSSSGGSSSSTTTAAAAAQSSTSSSAASTGGASTSAASLSVSGGHLVDSTGKTVYLWVADTGPASTCSGPCATAWPPVPATGTPTAGSGVNAAQITVFTRADGTKQLVYNGHPLYYFIKDTAAGDVTGQGSNSFGSKWWLLDGAGVAITTTSAPSAPSSSSSSSGGGGYGY